MRLPPINRNAAVPPTVVIRWLTRSAFQDDTPPVSVNVPAPRVTRPPKALPPPAAGGGNAVSLYGTRTAPIDTRLVGGWGGWGRLEKVWGGRAGGGITSQTSPNLQSLPNLL